MIYPTQRAVLLTAAGAPLALVIGVAIPQFWFIGAAWIVLVLTLIMFDAFVGARPGAASVHVEAPRTASVGAAFVATIHAKLDAPAMPGTIEAALSADPKLEPQKGYRSQFPLIDGMGFVAIPFQAARRGKAMLDRVWVRWAGPMGLVWKQRVDAIDIQILVTPDVRPVRNESAAFLRDAMQGLLARLEMGIGAEFQALTDFRQGMDRRAIDWKHSARHSTLVAREYRTESNNQIVFALDTGRVMCEPIAGVPRVDRAVSAALLTAYIALKVGDRVSLFGFDSQPRLISGSVSNPASFPLLQRLAARFDYSAEETNYTLALSTLSNHLDRRSLIIIFTDIADPTSAELMIQSIGRLLSRHLMLFIVLRDEELENIMATEPRDVDDVTRAVTAAALLRERHIVIAKLRSLGVHVVETRHDQAGHALVNAYFDLKRRNAL